MDIVSAYKDNAGIYVEFAGTTVFGDDYYWSARYSLSDGYYAAKDFQAIAIGANNPIDDKWDGGDSVPDKVLPLASTIVDCNMTESELRGTVDNDTRLIDAEFYRAFTELEC